MSAPRIYITPKAGCSVEEIDHLLQLAYDKLKRVEPASVKEALDLGAAQGFIKECQRRLGQMERVEVWP